MDFTFLFIVVLMVLAAQSGNIAISIALFALLLITSKDKYMFAAAILGGVTVVLVNSDLPYKTIVMVGGLFVILLLLVREDTVHPTPSYGGGGGSY